MGMNRDMIGHVYPPSQPYPVTGEKISAFVKALGDTNPAYADGTVAPPTFSIVVTMNAMDTAFHDPALQLDYSRLVHSDQKFEYLRPIRVGDVLTVSACVEEIKPLGTNEIATFKTDVFSGDELVVTGWSKIVVRGPEV
jgi:acyl dehydratase